MIGVGGEAATRIYNEVVRGVLESTRDTAEERDYRKRIAESVEKIRASGGMVEVTKEWV